jgi:hypothetical protein
MLLKTGTVLMVTSSVGPPASKLNPEIYVKGWLKKVTTMHTTLLTQLLQKGDAKHLAVKISRKFSEGM